MYDDYLKSLLDPADLTFCDNYQNDDDWNDEYSGCPEYEHYANKWS